MLRKRKVSIFDIVNLFILTIIALSCIIPFIHILAVSLSSRSVVSAGWVSFWPMDFNAYSYEYVLERDQFWRSFVITLERIALGGSLNLFLVLLLAYPLSKDSKEFVSRSFYAWFFFITMLFSGGIIPLYVIVSQLDMMGTIWALTLPGAVPVFNIILMLNFYRQIPKELSDAAYLDGASHWTTLWRVFIPCSLPAIATITLFTLVGHWNSWFDGLIFSTRPEQYPLQTFLQTVLIAGDLMKSSASPDVLKRLLEMSDRTLKAAQIIIAVIPILMAYPFLQRYFVTGLVLGSVKG